MRWKVTPRSVVWRISEGQAVAPHPLEPSTQKSLSLIALIAAGWKPLGMEAVDVGVGAGGVGSPVGAGDAGAVELGGATAEAQPARPSAAIVATIPTLPRWAMVATSDCFGVPCTSLAHLERSASTGSYTAGSRSRCIQNAGPNWVIAASPRLKPTLV